MHRQAHGRQSMARGGRARHSASVGVHRHVGTATCAWLKLRIVVACMVSGQATLCESMHVQLGCGGT